MKDLRSFVAPKISQIIFIRFFGGIDLTVKRMKLDVDSDRSAVGQPMDVKALDNAEINGLYIKDIAIKPLKNLPEMLGIPAS